MNNNRRSRTRWVGLVYGLSFLAIAGASCVSLERGPINVILMISDGAGFNTYQACRFYEHGAAGSEVYDRFPVRLACTTYSRSQNGAPEGYDPERFWSNLAYGMGTDKACVVTDSAAAATALNTGTKTLNGRVNIDVDGNPLTTIAQRAIAAGKRAGAVTTVQISHATPAGVAAHNESRSQYLQIAREMIEHSGLSVIMGAGHPSYDNNGQPAKTHEYKYVGGQETWTRLTQGTTGRDWTLIETQADFDALAAATEQLPQRLIGVAQVRDTLQYKRDGDSMGRLNKNVPTLATMTRAALNVLSKDNPNGFYLMIEGGAVDWANHKNKLARMIEEQMDFNRAVEAVVAWIETNSSWERTLLIVTSDHETGMLWGPGTYIDRDGDGHYSPDADEFVGFQPIVNNGAGRLPGVQYGSGGHTNALVPLFAKGRHAERFLELVDGHDESAHAFWDVPGGRYVDNTDVYTVMHEVLVPDDISEVRSDEAAKKDALAGAL